MLMAMALPTLLASWAESAARQPNPPPKIVPIPRFRHLLSVPPEIRSKISDRLIYSYIILINHSSFAGYETKQPNMQQSLILLERKGLFTGWKWIPNTSGSCRCSSWTTITQTILWSCLWFGANHLCADISINQWGPVVESKPLKIDFSHFITTLNFIWIHVGLTVRLKSDQSRDGHYCIGSDLWARRFPLDNYSMFHKSWLKIIQRQGSAQSGQPRMSPSCSIFSIVRAFLSTLWPFLSPRPSSLDWGTKKISHGRI